MFRKPEIWAQDVDKVGSFWKQWRRISSMHFNSFWWFPSNFWPFWGVYVGSVPGSGMISPGEGNGNPLQYFCLKNPVDRGTWWATALRATKSWTWLTDWPLQYHLFILTTSAMILFPNKVKFWGTRSNWEIRTSTN